MRPIACLLLLAACKSKAPPPDPPAPAVSIAVDAGPPPAASAPIEGGVLAASDEAKKKYSEYAAALEAGRKATVAKKYDAAIKAFDDALEIRSGDARAQAEKGYAELLAGKLDEAYADLADASSTTDAVLGAQIWFNRGLVHEAEKKPDEALLDFWFANKLKASSAAQAKIGGRKICPVQIDRTRVASRHAASWRDVAKTIRASMPEVCRDAPKTDADAKKELVVDGPVKTPKGEVFLVRSGEVKSCAMSTFHVVQVAGSDFWISPEVGNGTMVGSGIETEDTVTIELFGPWVRASQTSAQVTQVAVCSDPAAPDVLFNCGEKPNGQFVGDAHPTLPATYTDHIIDIDAHAQVLAITDAASSRFSPSSRLATVTITGSTIKVGGMDCNLELSRGDGGL
jgi:hypothetical protein